MKPQVKHRFLSYKLLAGLGLLLALPTVVQAQFNFTTNNGAITITGYYGSDTNVTIPDTITGLSVTSIGRAWLYHEIKTQRV
jgi:hypothetical protein